jgi:hypothetical protein
MILRGWGAQPSPLICGFAFHRCRPINRAGSSRGRSLAARRVVRCFVVTLLSLISPKSGT